MKIKLLNMLILLILLQPAVLSQDQIDAQYAAADSLFDLGEYYDAVTEFKRLLFFDDDGKYKHEADYKIGLSYKAGGLFDNAVKHLSLAKSNSSSAEQEFEVAIDIVRVNILRRTTSRAHQLLDELAADSRYRHKMIELNYWRGWTYIFEDKWDAAATSFGLMDKDHPLKKLSEQVEDQKYSVTFAKVISYILPGAGQFYTRNYLSGLMSLGWNALWGYLTIQAFSENRALDGVLIGGLLWLRFYRGNIQNAEKLAVEENIKYSNEALKFLMDNYNGIKP